MKQNPGRKTTRREVICALTGVAMAGFGHAAIPDAVERVIIEWNPHMFSPDLQKYPFHAQAVYRPDVSGLPPDPLAVYLQRMGEEGIGKGVIVQPEPYGDDHSLVLDCLGRAPERLRGTSLFYPKDPSAPRKLAALVRQESRIVATRFHAHRNKEMYQDSFADSGVRALWKQAVDLDLIIELHIGPDYARQAGEAIAAFPGCKVLIDHLAEPHMGTGVEFADVLELAKYPNVWMKLSGIGHFVRDAPYYESALPFTSRVIREFGPDRLVWGSGTPQIVDTHMAGYTDGERAKVKGGNLSKWLNWKV